MCVCAQCTCTLAALHTSPSCLPGRQQPGPQQELLCHVSGVTTVVWQDGWQEPEGRKVEVVQGKALANEATFLAGPGGLVPRAIASVSSSPGKDCCQSPALSLPWDPGLHLLPSPEDTAGALGTKKRGKQRGEPVPSPTRTPRMTACLPTSLLPGSPPFSVLVWVRPLGMQVCFWGREELRTLTSHSLHRQQAYF